MEYKEIYDEINTVLWGDEIAKTGKKDVRGVDRGYLIELYNPFHTHLYKIIPDKHKRVIRLFKKFADKLYLETKDEYAIELMSLACMYVGDIHHLTDIMEILGTDDDPSLMFDQYKKEDAVEPVPESKYKLISISRNDGKIIKKKSVIYKFYEEAKADFDEKVKLKKANMGFHLDGTEDSIEKERQGRKR